MKPTEKQIKSAMNRLEITMDGKNGFYRGCLWYKDQIEESWISIDKQLPEIQMRCLVLFEGCNQPDLMWFMPEYQKAWKSIKIAYWQPLPQAPQK